MGGFSQKEKRDTRYKAHCTFDEEHKTITKENLGKGNKPTIRGIPRKRSMGKQGRKCFIGIIITTLMLTLLRQY